MADARSRSEWARFSALMALIANCNRASKSSRKYKPSDFDPYAKKSKAKDAVYDMAALKANFVPPNKEPKT